MTNLLSKLVVSCGLLIALSGCLYGQCMNGACALERVEYIKSIKAYGEHWVKDGVTVERWKSDWTSCGGLPDGSFLDDAPPRASNDVIFAALRKKRNALATCMAQRGYTFQPGDAFREP